VRSNIQASPPTDAGPNGGHEDAGGAHHQDAKRVGGLFRGLIVLMAARAMFDIRVTLPFDHDARSCSRSGLRSLRGALLLQASSEPAECQRFGEPLGSLQREPSAGRRARYRGRVAKTALSRISRGCGVAATDMRR